ncbi:hypothetical protein ACE193_18795 [Bernardetia sp. OM2101]|uniref:hypothetical protein n=1 Tax=Bernardetia sp. OM2101 TaxID=3344876 RepID=UPI0035D1131F
MKTTLFVLLFFICQSISFSQTLNKEEVLKTDTFFVWEVLDLQQVENTGFMYQDCNFINLLLESVRLGIIRPYTNDDLQMRLAQQVFEYRVNKNNIFNKIILKSKVNYQVDEIFSHEVIAISIYSEKGQLICAFSYQELVQNLLSENSEAMICLGDGLKIPLIEVFENQSFKTEFLKKVKIK